MGPDSPRALFQPHFPDTREHLTHYYVIKLGRQLTAIGEAEFVHQFGTQKWEARVITWGVNPVTHKVDPAIVTSCQFMTVRGPTFRLVPKEKFRGKLPFAPQS